MPKTKADRYPTAKQRLALWEEMTAAGVDLPDTREEFQKALRRLCERSLYHFAKWILGFRDLAPLHEELSKWLTDFKVSRRKLMLIPVGHLKTTLVSKSMPLHILIQPKQGDIYFDRTYSGRRGQNARLVLGAENKDKGAENLSVMAENLMTNGWIAWLWPHVVWDGPNDARKWTEHAIEIPRTEIDSEPSITALGAETPITGRHYDGIFPDDLATLAAAQSPPLMERARVWIKRSWTRLHEPYDSLHIGVGTHQGPDDIYVDWRKMPSVESKVMAIEEEGKPIWAERYTPEKIEKLRADTDAITWALWYMNQPVSAQWTAMNWTELREFHWYLGQGWGFEMPKGVEFAEGDLDEELRKRIEAANTPLARLANGLPLREVRGNREQMIRRQFGSGMNPEQAAHLRGKYAGSPADTMEKSALEAILGRPK